MALKITTTKSDIHWVKMLCYGESGIGKTYMIRSAPKPLVISAEKGLLSLRDVDIPVIEVNSMDDVRQAYAYAVKADDIMTICLDSLSELSETLLSEFKSETKDPRQAYGRMADEMGIITRRFRDIPNKHVYMIAKQQRLVDEDSGKVTFCPMIPGRSFSNNLPYFFDIVGCLRLGKREKEEYRYIQTQPTIQYEAKDRSGNLAIQEEPDLTKLFNKIVGK